MSDLLKRPPTATPHQRSFNIGGLGRDFRAQQNGAVALLFGLLILPLLFAAGAAVDYGRRSGAKAQLDAALDAALLGIAARKTNSVTAEMLNSARTQFLDDAKKVSGVQVETFDPTTSTIGQEVRLAATYTATVTTSLGKLMNIQNMGISGRSETVRKVQQYIDFYLLLDNSPSMGLAATTADITSLKKLTEYKSTANPKIGCAFACHLLNSNGTENQEDNYNIAIRNNVTLRIHRLREAVWNLVDRAQKTMSLSQQFRMEMWTFSDFQTRLIARTPDLARVQQASQQIDMAYSYQSQSDNQTSYERALKKMTDTVPASGTGLTADDPIRFLFFVTDGVQDSPIDNNFMSNESAGVRPYGNSNRFISPVNPESCRDMKEKKGIKIGIIYTQYLPLWDEAKKDGDTYYRDFVRPFENKIGPMLEKCASNGLYFPVAVGGDINKAMQELFETAIASVRITN